MKSRWRWRRRSDGEPMTLVRADYYLTRAMITAILCDSTQVETGTPLSSGLLLSTVRAWLLTMPGEPWEEDGWALLLTENETRARREWPAREAEKFYERTA